MVPRKDKLGGARKNRRTDTASLILDPAARRVAFSKRRSTLFTMAGDLSALCGVDTAAVVFSSSRRGRGKAYAFGSPSVDDVLRRLPTDQGGEGGAAAPATVDGEEATAIAAMRKELKETTEQVKVEKARLKAGEAGVGRAMEAAGTTLWWDADVNALDAAELTVFEEALVGLKDSIVRRIDSLHADKNGA